MLIATGFVFVSRFFIEDRDGENIYICTDKMFFGTVCKREQHDLIYT